MKTRFPCCTLLLLFLTGAAQAQTVPALVNYQGRLANPDGTALTTGDYQLTFRVYDSATNSGGLIWGPQVFDGVAGQGYGGKIPVVQGYFNVMLGPVDTNGVSLENAFNATNRYVEIRVGTNSPILPRQQILSAPFALQAGNSAKLAGADWSAVFGTNDPVNGKIPLTILSTNGAVAATSFSGSGYGITGLSGSNLVSRVVGTNVPVGGLALSLSSSNFSVSTGGSYVDATNLSITIATTGRPVFITLTPENNGDNGGVSNGYLNWSSGSPCDILLLRNGTAVSKTLLQTGGAGGSGVFLPGGAVVFLDAPAAGTYSYKLQLKTGGNTLQIKGLKLTAYEL